MHLELAINVLERKKMSGLALCFQPSIDLEQTPESIV